MIYTTVPYNLDKNIGVYYNNFMDMIPNDDDFACFVDGDTMFLTPYWGKQLQDIIENNPDCGFFTAVTNRVACPWQIEESSNWSSDNINEHRELAKNIETNKSLTVEDVTDKIESKNWFSGFLILIRKSTWKNIGKFAEVGMIKVDNDYHRRAYLAGETVLQMKGVYLYHWYRGGDFTQRDHLMVNGELKSEVDL
jgi:GT2 family glycosyltransferase